MRRYAWSAKLPLSILTDFEELAVYDCRTRPADQDKASVARVNYYTFEEYADRWREIWDVFSREAVWAGSFDQYAETAKGKRGTTPVDAEFLKEIEGWRDVLARNLALRNAALSIDELNDAVQRTIDRIIFLRMAEDRGIEPYERLTAQPCRHSGDEHLRRLDRPLPPGRREVQLRPVRLLGEGRPADARRLTLDDKVLKPILVDLYLSAIPYEFSVLPVEILGNVYEQFLGKVIRLTPAHQAKVEEKPEVKKAGGVYYTPGLHRRLHRQAHGRASWIEGKTPDDRASCRRPSACWTWPAAPVRSCWARINICSTTTCSGTSTNDPEKQRRRRCGRTEAANGA